MRSYEAWLDDLAGLCGIVPEYYDIFGKKHAASQETNKAILAAMGLKVDSVEDLEREYYARLWKHWKGFVQPVAVIPVNEQPLSIPVYLPLGEGEEEKLLLSWSLTDEKGRTDEYSLSGDRIHIAASEWIDGIRYIQLNLLDSTERAIGYYVLTVRCSHHNALFPCGTDHFEKTARVVITPDACFVPAGLRRGRAWGLSVNLYAIRSGRNWGVGDFGDLERIVRWIADLKGGFVGINPLHAIPDTRPFGISPYSPISRLYKNFIYLDIERIPEVGESKDVREEVMSETFREKLEELRKGDLVDYEKVASLKEEVARKAFNHFCERHFRRNTQRGREFREYLDREGDDLESFATFMALASRLGGAGKPVLLNWHEWPEEYRDPSGKAVLAFRKAEKREILFYQYLQWLIDEQLKEIDTKVDAAHLSVGLYNDLAVGSIGGGSDAWRYQYVVAGDVVLGAPPDDFNLNGQDWGFPPLISERLKETGYELFIQTIRKNMKYGGALRIDHALGIFRLFWIPRGMSPKEGAYVGCPWEDLLRIIALESVRNSTMVIAEDLGTVGENVRETLQKFHMLSYRLLYFEKNYPEPSFLSPDWYPEMALCAVTTHDLPTLYGFWAGRDLEVKKRLGLFRDDSQWQEQVSGRERDKRLILSSLKSHGIIPEDYPEESGMIPDLCLAIYRYLAMTPCKLVLVSLDDIIGTMDQQNLPGTVFEHPNWLQKIPFTVEEIIPDRRFVELADMFRKAMGLL